MDRQKLDDEADRGWMKETSGLIELGMDRQTLGWWVWKESLRVAGSIR